MVAGCAGGDEAAPFRSPVHARNFPYPFVLRVDGTWHAYATNGAGGNVQTLTSSDLVGWVLGADALPDDGRWAYEGKTWAPEVLARVLDLLLLAARQDREAILLLPHALVFLERHLDALATALAPATLAMEVEEPIGVRPSAGPCVEDRDLLVDRSREALVRRLPLRRLLHASIVRRPSRHGVGWINAHGAFGFLLTPYDGRQPGGGASDRF